MKFEKYEQEAYDAGVREAMDDGHPAPILNQKVVDLIGDNPVGFHKNQKIFKAFRKGFEEGLNTKIELRGL